MRPIDADAIRLPKSFFEDVDNVPKFYEWLSEQPTINPMKHGRWDKDSIAFYWRCSECGAIVKSNLWDVFLDPFSSHRNLNYCPNCGARMDEVEEE